MILTTQRRDRACLAYMESRNILAYCVSWQRKVDLKCHDIPYNIDIATVAATSQLLTHK